MTEKEYDEYIEREDTEEISPEARYGHDLMECFSTSEADAKHFAESGLAEVLGKEEEDIRNKLFKINYAKLCNSGWGDIFDDPDFVQKVLNAIVRGDSGGDGDARVSAVNWIFSGLFNGRLQKRERKG